MIEVQNLTKRYRDLVAVNNISFTVKKGDILGFLGPNGAGKTTTMRMLTGFLSPTSGAILINGESVFETPLRVKKQIGYLPEVPPLYMDMTVRDYLKHVAALKGIPHRNLTKEVNRASGFCQLERVEPRLIRHLSKGFKQRVGLAQSLLGSPAMLILDEPTSGLDPAQIREVRSLIRELAQEHTVILSTHILPEVKMICNRAIIINEGKMLANDTVANLGRGDDTLTRLHIQLAKPNEKADKLLSSLKQVSSVNALVEHYDFEVVLKDKSEKAQASFLKSLLNDHNLEISEYQNVTPTLEDVFLEIISGKSVDMSAPSAEKANEKEAPAKEDKKQDAPKASAKKEAKEESKPAKTEEKKEEPAEEEAPAKASEEKAEAKEEAKTEEKAEEPATEKVKAEAKPAEAPKKVKKAEDKQGQGGKKGKSKKKRKKKKK